MGVTLKYDPRRNCRGVFLCRREWLVSAFASSLDGLFARNNWSIRMAKAIDRSIDHCDGDADARSLIYKCCRWLGSTERLDDQRQQ
jgi:hypothetical protein